MGGSCGCADVLDGGHVGECDGCLYNVEAAFVHLDGVQPEVFVCDGLGGCVAFGD